jgi:type II secretory pathway pseudopilin PulG
MVGFRRRHRRGNDRGETLVELLVTIVVLGLTIPALMGAVLISVSASSQDRRQVQAQALLNSWAETIERENSTDALYTNCPALTYYETAPFAPASIPAGFTPSVVAITYWDTPSGTFVVACASPDSGVRKVQLKVTVVAGLYPAFDVTESIVVRKPCLAC